MPTPKSCLNQEPLIKFKEASQAPVIDFQLPDTSSFVANVYIPINKTNADFMTSLSSPPANNYYDKVASLPPDAIEGALLNILPTYVAKSNLETGTPESAVVTISPSMSIGNAILQNLNETNQAIFVNSANQPPIVINGESSVILAEKAKHTYPVLTRDFAGNDVLKYQTKPKGAVPKLTIVEHYRVNTYLADYGAGKTVKTFSLLPGEKTTISIKTFKSLVKTAKDTQNVLDSFTDESAKEFESIAENETNQSSKSTSETSNSVGGGINFSIPGVPIGGSVTADHKTTNSSVREQSVKALNRSISKQVQKSVSNRKVEVNTENTSTETNTEENSVVRIIENVNKSRTLNFVFRQLNQELVTVIYLDDISFVFSNGYEEVKQVVKIDGLFDMLKKVMSTSAKATDTFKEIINQLGNVYNYQGQRKSLLKKYKEEILNFFDHNPDNPWPSPTTPVVETTNRFIKDPELEDTYTAPNGMEWKVKGIIQNVTHRVLPTDSLIVDALLGGGEALDCYSATAQQIDNEKDQLENEKTEKGIAILDSITAGVDKATAFDKMFNIKAVVNNV